MTQFLQRDIAKDDLRIGDHVRANIICQKQPKYRPSLRKVIRVGEVKAISGDFVQIKCAGIKGTTAIHLADVMSAWGIR